MKKRCYSTHDSAWAVAGISTAGDNRFSRLLIAQMFVILIFFVNTVTGMSCQRPGGCGDSDGDKIAYSKSVPARSTDRSYGLTREGFYDVDDYSDDGSYLARDDDAFRDLVEESAQCAKETAGNGVAVSKRGSSNEGPDGVTSTLVRVGAGCVWEQDTWWPHGAPETKQRARINLWM